MDNTRVSVFYLSSDGGDWALYLQSKLYTKEYRLDTVLNDMISVSTFHRKSAKLNVFLITPHFLESYVNFRYLENFDKMTSILVLTGIEYKDLEKETKRRDCSYILEWCIHELRETEESIRELMIKIIKVYEGHHVDTDRREREDEIKSTDKKAVYNKLPRKVNRVMDIIQKDNTVYILLENPPEESTSLQFPTCELTAEYHRKVAVCSFHCSDLQYNLTTPEEIPFTVVSKGIKLSSGTTHCLPENGLYKRLTLSCSNVATQTDVVHNEITTEPDKANSTNETINSGNIFETDDYTSETDNLAREQFRRTSDKFVRQTYKCAVDDGNSKNSHDSEKQKDRYKQYIQIVNEEALSTSKSRSKLELLQHILKEEVHPIRLLCKAFGINNGDVNVLDETLAGRIEGLHVLRKLALPSDLYANDDADHGMWPSLLHFGAQYNLKRFCAVLVSNNLGEHACSSPNKRGKVSHELAKKYDHVELTNTLTNVPAVDKEIAVQHDDGFAIEPVMSLTMSVGPGESDDGTTLPDPPTAHAPAARVHPYTAIDDPDEDETLNEMLEHQKNCQAPYFDGKSRRFVLTSLPSDEVLPTKQPKKGGLIGRIFRGASKKRHCNNRRSSEPAISSEMQVRLRQNQGQIIQEKQQKRKSIRLCNAENDISLQGPKLPTRNSRK